MFRNLTLFRFPASVSAALAALAEAMEPHRLRAVGPMELETRGFVSPYGRDENELVVDVRGGEQRQLLCMGWEERLLPAVVIAEEVADRIGKLAEREGRRPGGKERKRIKEEAISDLLPRSFVKPGRVLAYFNARDGWLAVDTASRRMAETVVSQIREALGRFPATPLAPEESPRNLMTGWLIDGKLPEGFTLGEECDLFDPAEGGSKWSGRRTDLESDEVREHLRAGMQVLRLGLVYRDRLSFTLGEDLVVRKLRMLDVDIESVRAETEAMFALLSLEAGALLADLARVFRIDRPGERD